MTDAALAFFDRRERAVYATRAGSRRRAFAADAAAAAGHPFWIARADGAERSIPARRWTPPRSRAIRRVLAAFEDLRTRPAVHFRTGDARSRFGRVPRSAAAKSSWKITCSCPAWPDGLRYIRDVDLVALMRLAPRVPDVGDLADAYAREHGPVALPDLLGALATLIAKGALAYG